MKESDSNSTGGFAQFSFGRRIRDGIAAAGFTAPRPIQEATITEALAGRDILGLAQTGTGKTAAFALPLLEKMMTSRGSGVRALILAPTRELAAQIDAEIRVLARFTGLKSTTVFGGVSVHRQREALRQRPDIVVACPGRLLDLQQQGIIRLDRIETLVIDEADHMFDMGFLPDIKRILSSLPKQRQNLLFSATMPGQIRVLASSLLNHPHVVDVSHSTPLATIEHALYPVDSKRKIELLEFVLDDDAFVSAIVFTRTKHRAKRIARQLESKGLKAVALQGNMSQGQRERAMKGFRNHSFDILVATDIAARGIDVEQVSHVVNFDMPDTPDAYTHRIGRTGRSERSGKAFTFVTVEDREAVRDVERRLGKSIPRRSVPGFEVTDRVGDRLDEGKQRGRGQGRPVRSGNAQPRRSAPPRGRSEGHGPARPGQSSSARRRRAARTQVRQAS